MCLLFELGRVARESPRRAPSPPGTVLSPAFTGMSSRSRTLLSPLSSPSSAPALILPRSATTTTTNLTLSYSQLATLVDSVRSTLDTWDGNGQELNKGDVVSSSLINGIEFAASFLGIGAHRLVTRALTRLSTLQSSCSKQRPPCCYSFATPLIGDG